MDVHNPRERPFSILNDNDSPSFAVRPRQIQPSSPRAYQGKAPRLERPPLWRQNQHSSNTSTTSSAGSPPTLRSDSPVSKSPRSSMDSSPGPLTPVYNDPSLMPYDSIYRSDGNSYLATLSSITPLMEQQMMLTPSFPESMMQYPPKNSPHPLAQSAYPISPAGPIEAQQMPISLPTSKSKSTSISAASDQSSPTSQHPPCKKNKYPCPYAASHNCLATFTTSGHAARHGKKHTGEKGVHCSICNKAFTRKDNMKQHERTHKASNGGSGSEDSSVRKRKAALTKGAPKESKKAESIAADMESSRSSILHSPLSDVASLAPASIDASFSTVAEPTFYEPNPLQMTIPVSAGPDSLVNLYPPLGDEAVLNATTVLDLPLEKNDLISPVAPPPFIRGYSDLDTLAQAAESFDPYYTVKYEGN